MGFLPGTRTLTMALVTRAPLDCTLRVASDASATNDKKSIPYEKTANPQWNTLYSL